MPSLKLTVCDWEEIYYALDSKAHFIQKGYYGDETGNRQWVEHLREIMKKVGEDGHAAPKVFSAHTKSGGQP